MGTGRVADVAIGALIAGIGATLLLHVDAPGLNLGLLLLLAGSVVAWSSRGEPPAVQTRALLLCAAALGVGSLVALRDSPALVALDIVVALFLLALVPAARRGSTPGRLGVAEYGLTAIGGAIDAGFGGFIFLVSDVPWREIRDTRRGPAVVATVRGILLAIPPLIVFGALLASADPAFNKLLSELLRIDELLIHALLFWIFGWLALGWLRRSSGEARTDWKLDLPSTFTHGATEAIIVLGAIDVLFAMFVGVQFRYFFGGGELVRQVAGLTWANYARRGFFELAWVAGLALALLLLGDWLTARVEGRRVMVIRFLALVQVALVLVILVSAWERMSLYRDEFGLTELRLYTSAFMLWIGVVLLWFVVTVLQGRREPFATGVLVVSVIAAIAVNAVNPDDLIVRTNIERALAGKRLDVGYIARLSADATPALADSAAKVDPAARLMIETELRSRLGKSNGEDWRSWNWSRQEARARLDRERVALGAR